MKNIVLIGFLLLLFSTCEKNLDITTVETTETDPLLLTLSEETGRIIGAPSDLGKDYFTRMHDASVQLIYNGEILDETSTDGAGYYAFSPQIIPKGAYVLVSAPGFYSNIRKADTTANSGFFNLIPTYFGDFSGSGLSDQMEVVRINGSLQSDNAGSGNYFYVINEANELIGNFISDGVLSFDITTKADTDLFLYHQNSPACPLYGPVALGAFSDDQDIGHIYVENNDAYKNEWVTVKGKAKNCDNNQLSSGGYYLVKYGNTTISHLPDQITPAVSDQLFYAAKCELEASSEIIITAVNHEESSFGEYTLVYSGETVIENIDITTCIPDDTYLNFTLEDQAVSFNNFTTANLTTDGRVVVKQIAVSTNSIDGNIGFEFTSNGSLGTYEAKFILYLNSSSIGVITKTQNLAVSIVSNDGGFLEGTISGEVYDAYEMPLGSLTGSFKARIQ